MAYASTSATKVLPSSPITTKDFAAWKRQQEALRSRPHPQPQQPANKAAQQDSLAIDYRQIVERAFTTVKAAQPTQPQAPLLSLAQAAELKRYTDQVLQLRQAYRKSLMRPHEIANATRRHVEGLARMMKQDPNRVEVMLAEAEAKALKGV